MIVPLTLIYKATNTPRRRMILRRMKRKKPMTKTSFQSLSSRNLRQRPSPRISQVIKSGACSRCYKTWRAGASYPRRCSPTWNIITHTINFKKLMSVICPAKLASLHMQLRFLIVALQKEKCKSRLRLFSIPTSRSLSRAVLLFFLRNMISESAKKSHTSDIPRKRASISRTRDLPRSIHLPLERLDSWTSKGSSALLMSSPSAKPLSPRPAIALMW